MLKFLGSADCKVALTAVRVFYVLLASQSPVLPSEELGSEACLDEGLLSLFLPILVYMEILYS